MNIRLIKYSGMIYIDELGKNGNAGNIYIYTHRYVLLTEMGFPKIKCLFFKFFISYLNYFKTLNQQFEANLYIQFELLIKHLGDTRNFMDCESCIKQ